MVKKLMAGILFLSLVLGTEVSFAAAKQEKNNQVATQGPRKQLTTIVFGGLAGAILGLSTLSFYGRPQDRLSNVPVGAAVGVIIAAIYTTYMAAAEPKEFYNDQPVPRSLTPEQWALDTAHDSLAQTPRAGFTLQF